MRLLAHSKQSVARKTFPSFLVYENPDPEMTCPVSRERAGPGLSLFLAKMCDAAPRPRLPVRRARPDPQDVRPGFRDAPAKFYMVRASGHTRYCLKGNVVTFPASHQVFPTKVAVVIGSTSKPRPMRDGCQMLPCRSRPLVMNQGRSCSSMPRPLRHDRYLRCRSRRTVNAMR
jgi:hypothetical protein